MEAHRPVQIVTIIVMGSFQTNHDIATSDHEKTQGVQSRGKEHRATRDGKRINDMRVYCLDTRSQTRCDPATTAIAQNLKKNSNGSAATYGAQMLNATNMETKAAETCQEGTHRATKMEWEETQTCKGVLNVYFAPKGGKHWQNVQIDWKGKSDRGGSNNECASSRCLRSTLS